MTNHDMVDQIYSFIYRGHLARQATSQSPAIPGHDRIAQMLPLEMLTGNFSKSSRGMAAVCLAISAFTRSVRAFVRDRLLEPGIGGENWWEACVPGDCRERAMNRLEKARAVRFHVTREDSPFDYSDLDDLSVILEANQAHFRELIPDMQWAKQILDMTGTYHNILLHAGELSMEDIERLGMAMRDWLNRTGK